MQLTTSIIAFIAAAASTVSAGTFTSPTQGQALSSTSPFQFRFDGGRYSKESSISVSVLLASSQTWTGSSSSQASTLVAGLQPTGPANPSQIFSAQLSPKFLPGTAPGSGTPSNWTLVVLERYNSYGAGEGTALWTQAVTFSD